MGAPMATTPPTPSGGNFSITDFIKKAESKGGLLRTSRFAVQVQGPSGISTDTLDVNLYCTQASFPARKFSTGSKKIYGSEKSIPYTATFDETVDLTFFCSAGMEQRTFFEEWQNKIQNPMNYNMGYHKEYVGTVFIGVFPEESNDIPIPSNSKYIIELEEAWPSLLSNIDLNSGTGELMKFSCSISYKRWIRKEWKTQHASTFGSSLVSSNSPSAGAEGSTGPNTGPAGR